MENELLECQRCLELKVPTEFYLKSAKSDPHERREKICKHCKRGRRVHNKLSRNKKASSEGAPAFELAGLEDVMSVFLRLRQWRDEREAVRKVSNQDDFDTESVTEEKEIWRSYA